MRALLSLVALLALRHVASAQDLDTATLTYARLGTGIQFLGKDKRLTLTWFGDHGGWVHRVEVSTPLDEETRIAAFTDDELRLSSGFKGRLYLGYDRIKAMVRDPRGAPTYAPAQSGTVTTFESAPIQPWDVGGEVAFQFDRMNRLREDDVSAAAKGLSKYAFSLGLRGAFYSLGVGKPLDGKDPNSARRANMVFTLQTGAKISRGMPVSEVRVCEAFSSSMASLRAERCEDALVSTGRLETSVAGYARLSWVTLIDVGMPLFQLGTNLSFNTENLNDKKQERLVGQAILFFSPTDRPVPAMFGVGGNLIYARDGNDLAFVPLALVGGAI